MPRPMPLDAPVTTIVRPASGAASLIPTIIVGFNLMRLLVSVRNAVEAQAALAGGADIVDAKEPLNGALGQVAPATLLSIAAAVAGAAPLSVALGDYDSGAIDDSLNSAATTGVAFVKIGFAGCRNRTMAPGPRTDQAPGTRHHGPEHHVALIVV